jgi:hypothetical protein
MLKNQNGTRSLSWYVFEIRQVFDLIITLIYFIISLIVNGRIYNIL